jgi:ribosomal-protein-alanine N-acetyltransferase
MRAAGLERIETERMIGERLRPGDGKLLASILTDPRVARTLFPAGPPGVDSVHAILGRHVEHWDRRGFGLWLLRDAVSGRLVGRGGLLSQTILGRDEVEAGWAIVPERWGEGLATELALASITVAWDRLGLDELISFTIVDNVASRRVMEKAGFAYERDFEHVGHPHALYRLRRAWRTEAAPGAVLGSPSRHL